MKKITVLLVLLALTTAGVAFAQEDEHATEQRSNTSTERGESSSKDREIELFNLELGFAYPIHWTNGGYDNVIPGGYDKVVTANTAVDIGLSFNFTKKAGLSLDMDMFYGAKLTGITAPDANHNSLFGLNVFLGPIFYVFNNDTLRIPLGFGVHMYYFTQDLWITDNSASPATTTAVKINEMQIGPAITLGVQFHFDNNLYLFSRTSVAFDIVRFYTVEAMGTEDSFTDMLVLNWFVKPSIGLGIKF